MLYNYNMPRPPRPDHKIPSIIGTCGARLTTLFNYNVTHIKVPDELHKLITNFDIDIEDSLAYAEQRDPLFPSYLYRQKVNVYKLAGPHCLSRNLDRIVQEWHAKDFCSEGHELVLDESDVLWAIGKVMTYWDNLQNLIMDWRKSRGGRKVPLDMSEHYDRISRAFTEKGERFMAQQPLSKASGLGWEAFKSVANDMWHDGDLHIKTNVDTAFREKFGIKTNVKTLYSLEPFEGEDVPQEN